MWTNLNIQECCDAQAFDSGRKLTGKKRRGAERLIYCMLDSSLDLEQHHMYVEVHTNKAMHLTAAKSLVNSTEGKLTK